MNRTFTCLVVLIFNLFLINYAFSQGQTNQWFFGLHAGINFNTTPPTSITGGVMTHEGSSSICDAAGNLIFYTNGDSVYTKQHQLMVNGTGLGGHYSASQSALIVKKPASATEYYVFTVDNCGGPLGFSYSIVDMSLQSGMGQVTTKNVVLYTPTSEKMAAVRHCNGTDFWIVTHKIQSDTFVVFQLTPAGVNSVPVKTSIGSIHYQFCGGGSLKISPNGRRLATGTQSGIVEIFDFDVSSGVVSNHLMLENNITNSGWAYGVEFSGDGTKLYASKSAPQNTSVLYQWNLCAGTPTLVVASQYTVGSSLPTYLGSIQRGPDDLIYFAVYNQSYLGAIRNPNALGAACNFTINAISIAPNLCRIGLPSFVADDVPVPVIYTISSSGQSAACSNASFNLPVSAVPPPSGCTAPPSYSVTSVLWNFGDPSSASSNTSAISNPTHNFSGPGSYTVKVTVSYATCAADTFYSFVKIPDLSVTSNTVLGCTGSATAAVSLPGNYSYVWGPGSYTNSSVSGLTPGVYTVTATGSANGCVMTKTVQLNGLAPSLTVSGTFTICKNAVTTLTASGASTYSWSTGSTQNTATMSPLVSSVYSVTGTNTAGCSTQSVVAIQVFLCTDVADAAENGVIEVYPNPVRDRFIVNSPVLFTLIIHDQFGREIVATRLPSGNNIIDLSSYPAGIYYGTVVTEKQVHQIKLVKEN